MCYEPDVDVGFARRAESSPYSGSSGRVHGRVTYSDKVVLVAVIEATSSCLWPEDLTTKWHEYAWPGFLRYVVVHRREMKSEAEDRVTVEPLQPFCGQAVDAMVGSEIVDVRARGFRQGRTRKSAEGFYCWRVFRGDEAVECSVLKKMELVTKGTVGGETV